LKLSGAQIKISPPEVTQAEFNPGLAVQPMPMGGGAVPFNVMRSFQVVVVDADFADLHKKVLKVMETALTHGANAPANLSGNVREWLGGGFHNGGASITHVDFFSRSDVDPRQQAYRKAVETALENAKAAAQGAGAKLGDIVSIREHREPNLNVSAGIGIDVPTELIPQDVNGEIELTVRVRLSAKF
jgi:hypothetical protein